MAIQYSFLFIAEYCCWRQLGGQKGVDDKAFPMKMEMDHVRVYQAKE